MSGINSIGTYDPSLAALLAQAQDRTKDSSPVDEVASNAAQPSTAAPAAPTAADASDLETQVQGAISAALQGAEQSGGGDLKDAIYNALVKVLKDKGIDPKTLKPTADAGDKQDSVSLSTSEVLAQIMAAVNKATVENNPLLAMENGNQSEDGLWSALAGTQGSSASAATLAQRLALEKGAPSWSELPALLAASQKNGGNAGNVLSQMLSPETNNQNLLGFLFDSDR